MIAKNKIWSIHYRGKPLLRIPKHSERSENERKISNDEECLSECRQELQEMASRHCSSLENPNEGNLGVNGDNTCESSSDESEDESEGASNLGCLQNVAYTIGLPVAYLLAYLWPTLGLPLAHLWPTMLILASILHRLHVIYELHSAMGAHFLFCSTVCRLLQCSVSLFFLK